jgi:nucleoside 2-deoxyribosyltransferase
MTMKHQIFSLIVVTALLPGCVTYLIEDDVKAQRKESERTYYFTAYKDQAARMAAAGSCIKAATHFEQRFVPHEQTGMFRTSGGNTTPFKDEDLKVLDERIKAEARILTDTCLAKEAPALQEKRRFERLAELFRRLALLPIPEEEQKALVLRADTADLLRADAAVADAQQAWDAGKVYEALSGFMSAKNIAAGVKAATDEQKAKYARLLAEKQRAHVDDMLKKAGEAGRSPDTAHLAAIYLARAYEVGNDKAIGRRLEATRQELLASHVYHWQVEWKGEPRITKAAKQTRCRPTSSRATSRLATRANSPPSSTSAPSA